MVAVPADAELPLFPLSAVLYPGGRMRLRIFERRYLDMVRDCIRDHRDFGVCLILNGYDLEGSETGAPATPAAIGTQARIVDFHTGADGLLGLAVEGGRRFRTLRTRVRDDGLLRGEVSWLADEPTHSVPVAFALLQTILERLIESMPNNGGTSHWRDAPRSHYDDAGWVGFRLAELLPLTAAEHQRLLELVDPLQRLGQLQYLLPRFQRT